MNNNSFLHPTNELHYDKYRPADAAAALDATEKLAHANIAAIVAVPDGDRTIDNTLLALSRCAEDFYGVAARIGHLESVLGKPWSKADLLATERASKLGNEIGLNEDLYKALVALRALPATKKASAPRQKLLKDTIEDYERGGIALPKKQKETLKKLRKQLSEATTKFGQNTVKAQDAAGVHITDIAELKGLDDDFIKQAQAAAKKKKLDGYWLQMSQPNFVKVMTDCAVTGTRHAMYKTGKSDGLEPNRKLAQNILALRTQIAHMLGFTTFADLATVDRMAKTGKTARDFIHDLRQRYQPGVAGEIDELRDFARAYEHDPQLELHISDVESGLDFYYASRLRAQTYSLDEKKVREYFPFDTVLQGMFQVLGTLYGVSFKKISEPAWHKDVQVYAIYDENGGHLATVWCDWFARKGKRSGAWMNDLYVANRADGNVTEPHLGLVVGNFDPPRASKPSLMTMDEVRTMWHEFGHFMHLTLNRTELEEQSMTGCQWDFIEAPSQIMENWPKKKEILQIIGKHYKTGDVIPDDIIANLDKAENFRVASKAVRQLIFAESDLALHMDFADDPNVDPVVVSNKIKEAAYGMKTEPYDKSVLNFTHVFSGGYAAGYYSYKWAETIEADFFREFEKHGVLNPAAGRRYRDKVLARGSEVDANDIVRDFLGRDSTVDAMLIRDGIKK